MTNGEGLIAMLDDKLLETWEEMPDTDSISGLGDLTFGDIRAVRTALSEQAKRIEVLEEALRDAREALALGAAVPPTDHRNRSAVIELGERIGYGALMATASSEWRSVLGDLIGGEFCAGPCRSTAEAAIAKIDAALKSGAE